MRTHQSIFAAKVVSLVAVLLLVGAGCAKSPVGNGGTSGNNAVSATSVPPGPSAEGEDETGGSAGSGTGTAMRPNTDKPLPLIEKPITLAFGQAATNSGMAGSVTFTGLPADKTQVDVAVSGTTSRQQYAAIYAGTCKDTRFNEEYKLDPLFLGKIRSTADANINKLFDGTPRSIRVKFDPVAAGREYALCADLVRPK